MTVARFSSSGGVAIRYVLPVLCMTLYLHIMARNRRRDKDVSLYSNWINKGQEEFDSAAHTQLTHHGQLIDPI